MELNSNLNSNVTGLNMNQATMYGLTNLKDVISAAVVPTGFRECRIIVKGNDGKNAGKVSQYCTLPEVTVGFAQSFINSNKGLELVQDFISTLQDKAARRAYIEMSRSPTSADLSIDSLVELGALDAVNIRLSKDSIGAWFDSVKNGIALFIAQRMNVLPSYHADLSEADKTASFNEFWNSSEGCKCIAIAANYKPLLIELAGKSPSFNNGVKAKLEMVCIAVMTGSAIEEKMLEKLEKSIEKSVDDLGL